MTEQAARTPHAEAVVTTDGVLTDADLEARGAALAARLVAAGAGPGTLGGACLPRDATPVTALLAVPRSGATYVPLNPAYPADRLAFLLDDTQAGVVITDRDHARFVDGAQGAAAPGRCAAGHRRTAVCQSGLRDRRPRLPWGRTARWAVNRRLPPGDPTCPCGSVPPSSETESTVARASRTVPKAEQVGGDDPFFERARRNLPASRPCRSDDRGAAGGRPRHGRAVRSPDRARARRTHRRTPDNPGGDGVDRGAPEDRARRCRTDRRDVLRRSRRQ
ncbi:AMP-binding protein [Streptomyces tibetensis]|uniref:AMP-binding protein n=1 Tax=Streptomyces tibetensis TaxID=2382123 RepID=UPI0033EBC5EF